MAHSKNDFIVSPPTDMTRMTLVTLLTNAHNVTRRSSNNNNDRPRRGGPPAPAAAPEESWWSENTACSDETRMGQTTDTSSLENINGSSQQHRHRSIRQALALVNDLVNLDGNGEDAGRGPALSCKRRKSDDQ